MLTVPIAPISKRSFYFIRYWDENTRTWRNDDLRYSSKAMALRVTKKCYPKRAHASVVAQLTCGRRVFISGTRKRS